LSLAPIQRLSWGAQLAHRHVVPLEGRVEDVDVGEAGHEARPDLASKGRDLGPAQAEVKVPVEVVVAVDVLAHHGQAALVGAEEMGEELLDLGLVILGVEIRRDRRLVTALQEVVRLGVRVMLDALGDHGGATDPERLPARSDHATVERPLVRPWRPSPARARNH